ncbi:MAG TPA: cache domain-containing protein, partial [Chloroflexota bacterium]|nr:cache domain-containing protein [Chloroflexota bacterium]
MQTAPKHGRGHSRIGDLSVGIKITILCVGLCAALAIALTAIGYRQASEGLRTQAESALASDAMTVASTVDGWNIQRIRDLQSLSANPVIQEFAAADPVARATQMKQIQGALKSLLDSASDEGLEAVGIMDSAGNFVADTASTLPAPSPQRDYFKAAMNGKAFISGVSISTVTNAASIYHSTPIKGVDGRVIAVLRSRAGLAPLQRAIEAAKSRMGKQSTGVLLDESGLVVASDVDAGWVMRPVIPLKPEILQPLVQEKRWGNNASPDPLGQTDLSGAIGAKKSARFNWKLQGKPFDAMVVPLTQTTWSYVEALPLEVVEAPANSFLQGSAIAALVALLLATFFAVLFARSLASTARHLAEGARHIASGDLDYEIKVSTGDEIGRAALAFKDLAASERALAETAQAVASGDLTRDVVARSESDVLGLAFRRMNASLRDLVGRVQSSVETLACSSTELGTTASQTGAALQETESTIQGMARGSQEQSEATEITSANMVQLSRAIDQIATGSQEQARSIEKTSASVAQLNLSIARVAGASEEVSLATQQARAAAASGADSVGKSVKGMQAVQASTTDVAARIAKLGSNSSQIGVIV